jgi:hypothetical protein
MKAILCVLLFLLGTISQSQALVVVYRGTLRSAISGNGGVNPTPARRNVYFIVDLAKRQFVTLSYFGTGEKKRYGTATPITGQITTAPVLGGTAVVLSNSATTFTDENNYVRLLTYFRGTNGVVTTRTEPATNQVTLPRSFTGYNILAASDQGKGTFFESVYSLPLDAKQTIAANNANRTLQATYDVLLQQLIKKGYKSNN